MVDWNALDYSTAPPGYRELRTSQVQVELLDMKYVVLSGRDHRDWLQGQSTNDVRLLDDLPWLDFCLTKPTGQIVAECRAWGTQDSAIVATAKLGVLIARAEESVILEDVVLTDVDEPFVCALGPIARPTSRSLVSHRLGAQGFDLPVAEAYGAAPLSPEAYVLATLEAGIPLLGVDYADKTLPPELGPHFESRHVSYTKGCYVGQEVLMRIKARGHTNKTWVGLRASSPIKAGAKVTHQGKEVGSVHRAAHSPAFGHIASATLKNEATQEGTQVEVDGHKATVVQMPFLR